MAGDAMQAEYDRCINLSKIPFDFTSSQHCQYVSSISLAGLQGSLGSDEPRRDLDQR